MRTEYLDTFISIAHTHNLQNTADELNLTKVAVSKQIKTIENEVGIQLCVTSNKGTFLTKNGVAFYEMVLSMRAEYLNFIEKLNNQDTLVFGLDNTMITKDFFKNHFFSQKINIIIKAIEYRKAKQYLYTGEIDFAFCYSGERMKSIAYQSYAVDNICFCVPNDHEYNKINTMKINEIKNQTIYYFYKYGSKTLNLIVEILKKNNKIVNLEEYSKESMDIIYDSLGTTLFYESNAHIYGNIFHIIRLDKYSDELTLAYLPTNEKAINYIKAIKKEKLD